MSADDALLRDLEDALAGRPTRQIVPVPPPAVSLEPLPRSLRQMVDEQVAADPERLPWPERWWSERDVGDYRACLALWSEALLHCLRSATEGQSKAERQYGRGAGVGEGWIGSRDFHIMCALAGLDGTVVEERIRRAQSQPGLSERLRPQIGRKAG